MCGLERKRQITGKRWRLPQDLQHFRLFRLVLQLRPHHLFVYLICIGITGIAESFRSVSVTPVAQSVLPQKDLGVGTALVTFVNSLSTLFAAAINGVVYGMSANNVQAGVNNIFRVTVIISMAGFFLVIFVVRKQLSGNEKAK